MYFDTSLRTSQNLRLVRLCLLLIEKERAKLSDLSSPGFLSHSKVKFIAIYNRIKKTKTEGRGCHTKTMMHTKPDKAQTCHEHASCDIT